jgi:uncharacterized cupredoxin-like copper-binding protein
MGVVAAAITALALAACGGNGDNGGEDAGGATAAATSAAAEASTVTVTETEFKIDMPETSLAPGTYTFVVENAGQIDHALEVEGSGIEEETDTIAPGSSAELTVTLEAGTYEVYCPIGNHRGQGMELELTVG